MWTERFLNSSFVTKLFSHHPSLTFAHAKLLDAMHRFDNSPATANRRIRNPISFFAVRMERSIDETLPLRRYTIDNQKVSGRVISELRITQANHIDRGDYTCVATNAYGHARAGIKLLVQEPPNFPRNLHVAEQGSRSLLLAWSSPSSEQDPAHASSPITKYIVQYKEAQGRLDDSLCSPRSDHATNHYRERHRHEFSPRISLGYGILIRMQR